jgi:hypothetical protein
MIFKSQLSNNSIIVKIPFWKLNVTHNCFQFYDVVSLASIPREITCRVNYWGMGSSWRNCPWGGSPRVQNAPWNSKILREILIIQLFPIVLKDCASALHIK